MSLAARCGLPRTIERNKDATLTLDVYSAASAQQTATGGTADGDTAFTAGSVRVRAAYLALNSLDNA